MPGPGWASWTSTDHFLPKEFHKVKGSGSLSQLKVWLCLDPLTMDDDNLASYSRVEIVALAVGLAMHDIWVIQFPENFSGIPGHITNSPFEFREYEQLSYDTKTLIDGYDDLYVSYLFCTATPVILMILIDLLISQRHIRRRNPLLTR